MLQHRGAVRQEMLCARRAVLKRGLLPRAAGVRRPLLCCKRRVRPKPLLLQDTRVRASGGALLLRDGDCM
jgi:hypothetical protein